MGTGRSLSSRDRLFGMSSLRRQSESNTHPLSDFARNLPAIGCDDRCGLPQLRGFKSSVADLSCGTDLRCVDSLVSAKLQPVVFIHTTAGLRSTSLITTDRLPGAGIPSRSL